MLRPLYLVFDDVFAILRGQAIHFGTGGLVYDNLVGYGVAEADYLVARNRIAALCAHEMLCAWLSVALAIVIYTVVVDKEGPELEYLARRT